VKYGCRVRATVAPRAIGSPLFRRPAAIVTLVVAVAAAGGTEAGLAAREAETPLPPIAVKKTTCPKKLFEVSGHYPVTVMVAAEKGHHPGAALLTCRSADAIALAGKKYFLAPPFRTGEKIRVGGASYTMGVGGPEILPATSGPVYGWFGNGIEVLLIVPSGP
jgi:hypothetical protein